MGRGRCRCRRESRCFAVDSRPRRGHWRSGAGAIAGAVIGGEKQTKSNMQCLRKPGRNTRLVRQNLVLRQGRPNPAMRDESKIQKRVEQQTHPVARRQFKKLICTGKKMNDLKRWQQEDAASPRSCKTTHCISIHRRTESGWCYGALLEGSRSAQTKAGEKKLWPSRQRHRWAGCVGSRLNRKLSICSVCWIEPPTVNR